MHALVLPIRPRRGASESAYVPEESPGGSAAAAGPAPSSVIGTTGAGGGARTGFCILIVDDDTLMTDMLPRRLRRVIGDGVTIVTATTPDDATTLMRGQRPDVVLSDYNLRHIRSGLDVLAETAELAPHAVRILISGHSRDEIDGIDDAGIHCYIEKPMRLDDLVPHILDAIQRECGVDLRTAGADG